MELIRFDMSEYMERHTVSRLIGAPPGYVGFDQGGLLTEEITKHPHSVLLLDEIEKAHPDVFNLLLQVMDHGTLTDNNGRKADFRNVVLVMTTNAGAEETSRRSIGFTEQDHSTDGMEALKNVFTPEFRNRWTHRPVRCPPPRLPFQSGLLSPCSANRGAVKNERAFCPNRRSSASSLMHATRSGGASPGAGYGEDRGAAQKLSIRPSVPRCHW
jgi:hypothetical protein